MPLGRVHLVGVGEAIKLMAYFTPVGPHCGLVVTEVRHIVPNVEIAFVPHGTGEVAHFVHPIAMPVNVFARLGVLVSEEGPALHVFGNRRAGQAQYGWGEIDEGYQAIQGGAQLARGEVLPFLREADHQGDPHATLQQGPFVAWHARPVIRIEEYDGVLG